jgi:RNA polymerase sigma-70 factor (ECF subfamily)
MPDVPANLQESLLVLRCQAEDADAFAQLVRAYYSRVHYYLRKMLASPDRADDALQELWIDVYRSIPTLRDPQAFPAWLYRLARNRAYRELRRARPAMQSIDAIDLPDEGLADDDFTREDAQRVHAALDQLPPEHREVLLLRFIESMTYEQIAQVAQCELGTVRSRIHYAKRTLRGLLERKNQHEPEPVRIRADKI